MPRFHSNRHLFHERSLPAEGTSIEAYDAIGTGSGESASRPTQCLQGCAGYEEDAGLPGL